MDIPPDECYGVTREESQTDGKYANMSDEWMRFNLLSDGRPVREHEPTLRLPVLLPGTQPHWRYRPQSSS